MPYKFNPLSGNLDYYEIVPSTTDDLAEGSNNLYWTQARFNTAFSAKDTDDLSEGTTNLYSPFSVSGSDIYYDGGKLGVGTIPDQTFHVRGDGIAKVVGTSTQGHFRIESEGNSQTWAFGMIGNAVIRYWDVTAGTFPFQIEAGAPTGTLYLDSTGNVGAGVVNPTIQLQSAGAVGIADGMSTPSTRTGYAQLYVDSSDGAFKIKFGDGTVVKIADNT